MTTIQSDKTTRQTSVPFVATSFSVNLGMPNYDDTVQPVDSNGAGIAVVALRVMRLSKPERGNLTQAYLNLFMTVGSAITAKVAVGRFDTDGTTAATPTQAEIDASHLAITGTTSPIASSGTTFIIDGLNVVSQIPKKGDTNYNADGIVLIVQFSRDLTTSDSVRRFELSCAMQMGLL